jgi:hypothetical protein
MPTNKKPSHIAEMADISDRLLQAISHEPTVDVEEVSEYLIGARQKYLGDLDRQVTAIKRFLTSMGAPPSAAEELDELQLDIQDRWTVALEAIEGMLAAD